MRQGDFLEPRNISNLFSNETNKAIMTDEQINVAIAAACGWENLHRHPLNPNVWVGENAGMLEEVLDYCTDLNAMHEAEATLGKSLYRMEAQLKRMAGAICFHASARQRAEAFLRTVGKWEEVQP
jgi:hypothetical protein